MGLHTLIPNLPTAIPKRYPVIHAWSKPEGAVSGRPLLPTTPKTGKTKIFSLPRCLGSADIADQSQSRGSSPSFSSLELFIQLTVILGKMKSPSRPVPVGPEIHRLPLPERALTAMPWALQHFGDKNVSGFRRWRRLGVSRISTIPSSEKRSCTHSLASSDEKVAGNAEPSTERRQSLWSTASNASGPGTRPNRKKPIPNGASR
jgi:hypothetical protein